VLGEGLAGGRDSCGRMRPAVCGGWAGRAAWHANWSLCASDDEDGALSCVADNAILVGVRAGYNNGLFHQKMGMHLES
jgi:hypothetical protein